MRTMYLEKGWYNQVSEEKKARTPRMPKLWEALVTMLILVGALALGIVKYETDPHVPMFIGVMGAALMALAVYFIVFSEKFRVRPTLAAGLIAGGVAGLSAGMFSIGGPPIVVYYLAAFQDKKEYTATTQMYFILTSLWLVAQHLWMGNVDALALQCTGAALAGLAVGTAAGLAVFRALPLEKIKKLVYAFMLVMGCYILITG